jgi:hypothetical protein
MKAVRFHEYGDADVLRYEDAEQPAPGAGEVRIRVAAAAFNPVDSNIRAGFMQGPIPVTLPHTLGYDVAGPRASRWPTPPRCRRSASRHGRRSSTTASSKPDSAC